MMGESAELMRRRLGDFELLREIGRGGMGIDKGHLILDKEE